MAEIKRTDLFGKLNDVAYKNIESATVFCKMRGNPYVELVHWFNQIISSDETDIHFILRHFNADASRLSADLVNALDALPRGATAIRDFSPQIELAIKEAWMLSTLLYKRSAIRTGDLLLACLRTKELRLTLADMSDQFNKVKAEELADHFYSITTGSREEGLRASDGTGLAASGGVGSESGAMAPAAMGKQEALKQYCTDLTEEARQGRLDPVVGRDAEVRKMIDILLRRRQNNPILTGEAGVGKTAVVEGLALRIASGDIPDMLKGVRLLSLDLQGLQAGASMRGEFENRLKQVIEEVQSSDTPIIVFIDEAHNLVGAGGTAGQGDAANLLKPALARGSFRCIAATTWSEYKKYFEKDPALTRRFQNILIEEPDDEKAHRMMMAVGKVMAKHHKVLILDEALRASVTLSRRYLPTRQLPDKAVSLLDTAASRVAFSQGSEPAEVEDIRRDIESLTTEIEVMEREHKAGMDRTEQLNALREEKANAEARHSARVADWQKENELVGRVVELRNALQDDELPDEERNATAVELKEKEAELAALQKENPLVLPQVDAQSVAAIISEWTGIPAGRMVSDEMANILNLSKNLGERVVGQDHGLNIIADRILSSRASLADQEEPIAVLMLAGPSGVGKTETAITLAETLYGGEQNLITINMSEFQEAHTVSTLKGAPPGYVGYGEGGVLTEAVRRKPYSVVLLDEVEKAHKDVHEIFFQVFDKGRMEDGEGRLIDFRNTVILLTTNVGTDEMMSLCADPELMPEPDQVAQAMHEAMLKVFPPALLGRLVVIPYYPLSQEVMNKILGLKLKKVARRLMNGYGTELVWGEELCKFVMMQAKRADAGARIIDNIITNNILPRLSAIMLQSVLEHKTYKKAILNVVDDAVSIDLE